MTTKVYSKFKKIYKSIWNLIKEEYKILIFYIIIIALFLIPTNYEILTPGSLLDISKRVNVSDGYETKGSLNITFVRSRGDSVMMYLLSYVIPNWDKVSKSNMTLPDEDYKDSEARNKIELENGNNIAIQVAFEKADKNYEVKNTEVIVNYVSKESNTLLKVGDKIVGIEDNIINNKDELKEYLNNYEVGDTVILKVLRNKKNINVKSTLIEMDDKPSIGIMISEKYDLITNPKVKMKYKRNESGSSGGLMNTLYIYNSLTSNDITKGLKIAGTGTISKDGSVGEIGGIKYKLIGAVRKHANVFLVPEENYEEAIKIKKKKNFNIKIIKVKNIDDALNKLNNL